MQYNRLGRAGLKVSQLSFGSWVTFQNQMDLKPVVETMAASYDYGVNFFDNAEVYANGKSEELMGQALKKLAWPRLKYIVSTKFYWGITDGPNERNTLNRKYLIQALDGSLKRMDMDFIDLIYCHRPDANTPLEETVWAMHNMIEQGKALYWGTSEWSAAEVMAAWQIADKHHLHKPVVEQPQYNLFHRQKVEVEFARLYEEIGLGLTTWSPLASGLLTGKYLTGIPAGSRGSMKSMSWLQEDLTNSQKLAQVKRFADLAKQYQCTPAQLAIAWCAMNPRVSTVITGASQISQVHENMKSLEVLSKLTAQDKIEIESIFA